MFRVIPLCGLICLPFQTAAAQDVRISEELRAYFDPMADTHDMSGSILIMQGDEVLAWETFGYSDWETQTPLLENTRFPVGSVTKSLTTAVIIGLADDGLLLLREPVRNYVTDLDAPETLTVERIITHTGGLPRDFPAGSEIARDSAEVINWLNETLPDTLETTGEVNYSNVGYRLLAILAEQVGETSFSELMDRYALTPARMTNSFNMPDEVPLSTGIPNGYDPGPAPLMLRDPMTVYTGDGAGGLVADLPDLVRWGRYALAENAAGLQSQDGDFIGSISNWEAHGYEIYTMQGSVPGYGGGISYVPELDIIMAYGLNITSYSNWGIRPIIHDIILEENAALPPIRPMDVPIEESHLDAVGYYQMLDFIGPIEIRQSDTGLEVVWLDRGWSYYLSPVGPDAFTWRLFNADMQLIRSESGEVTGMSVSLDMLGQPSIEAVAPRIVSSGEN